MARKRLWGLCALLLVLLLAGAFSVGFFHLDYNWGADQFFQSLAVEAELTARGDLHITETWQMQYRDRGRPYWNNAIFLREGEAASVSDLTVYDSDFRQYYDFAEGATAFDAGERACYLTQNAGLYELGWNFPSLEAGTRNFVVSYTLTGVGEHYADCDELAYRFVSGSNTFPVRRFSLRLRLPGGVTAAPGGVLSREGTADAWLHGPSGGNVTLEDTYTLYAEAEQVPAFNEVELRALMPPGSLQGEGLLSGTAMLESIRAQESQYATEHDTYARFRYLFWLLHGLLAAGAVVAAALYLRRQSRREKAALRGKAPLVTNIPSTGSPAVVARLTFSTRPKANPARDKRKWDSYALSATALALAHKRCLSLAPQGEHDVLVTVHEKGKSQPVGEEKDLLEFFTAVAAEQGGPFTLEELRAYGAKHRQKLHGFLSRFNDAVNKRYQKQGWVRRRRLVNYRPGQVGLALLVLAAVVALVSPLPGKAFLAAGLLVAGVLCCVFTLTRSAVTPRGRQELLRWRGFAGYLREYSLLTQNPLSEVTLWGDYMVYATALGLGKELSAHLALVYDRLAHPQDTGAAPAAIPAGLDEYLPPNPMDRYFDFTPAAGEEFTDKAIWQLSSVAGSLSAAALEVWDTAQNYALRKKKA